MGVGQEDKESDKGLFPRRGASVAEIGKHGQLLIHIGNVLATKLDPELLFDTIAQVVQALFAIDRASLALYDAERDAFEVVALALQEGTQHGKGWTIPHAGSRIGKAFDSGEIFLSTLGPSSGFYEDEVLLEEGMHTGLVIPLRVDGKTIGTFNVNCRREGGLTRIDADLLAMVADQIAVAVANSQAHQRVRRRAEGLTQENAFLQALVEGAESATSLLLHCPSMRPQVDRLVAAAQSQEPILITGETGTGKSVMAQAFHAWSGRRRRPFVQCDCAALASGAIESELFGHEKGVFDGATTARVGRFQQAEGGSLFLHEIAELPVAMQGRVLGVLQSGQARRVGAARSSPINIRIIASSNRDLRAAFGEQRFREDLYYRLNVLPIRVPPLRERPIDILPLANHFLGVYSKAFERVFNGISPDSERLLRDHAWPGNVRELKNVIEQAVVLQEGGGLIEIDRDAFGRNDSSTAGEKTGSGALRTLAEVEVDHIRSALCATRGRIAGPKGAAKILGLHPSTLRSRMEKLGIAHERDRGDEAQKRD